MQVEAIDGAGNRAKVSIGECLVIKGAVFKVFSINAHPLTLTLQPANSDQAKLAMGKVVGAGVESTQGVKVDPAVDDASVTVSSPSLSDADKTEPPKDPEQALAGSPETVVDPEAKEPVDPASNGAGEEGKVPSDGEPKDE
jgi:hypothetical protein